MATYTFYAFRFVAHPHKLLTGLREVMGKHLDEKQVEKLPSYQFPVCDSQRSCFQWVTVNKGIMHLSLFTLGATEEDFQISMDTDIECLQLGTQ